MAKTIAIIEKINPIIPGAFESFVAIPIIDNIKATIPRARPITTEIISEDTPNCTAIFAVPSTSTSDPFQRRKTPIINAGNENIIEIILWHNENSCLYK